MQVTKSSACFGISSKTTDLAISDFLFWGYISQRQQQQSVTLLQRSATIVREGRNMPAVLIDNVFDGIVNRCGRS